jgi:hypothetical protein
MNWIKQLFFRRGLYRDLSEEMREHLDEKIEELVAGGASREEATRAAYREFGNIALIEERSREVWQWPSLENFLMDVRYGVRQLRRNLGFTVAAVLTLGLGIGANTALFSAVNSLFFHSLPVPNANQLVTLGFQHKKDVGLPLFSYPDFRDLRQQTTSSVDLFAYRAGVDGLSEGGRADQILTNYVTGNYFTALGIKSVLGRLILPSEGEIPGSDPVLVLGYSYWKSHFGADPGMIGKEVRIDGHPFTVIGVAQKDFRGVLNEVEVQAYLPLNMTSVEGFGDFLAGRDARALFVLGRLQEGVSLQQAQTSLNVLAGRLSEQYPATDLGASISVFPQREAAVNPMPKPGEYSARVARGGAVYHVGHPGVGSCLL